MAFGTAAPWPAAGSAVVVGAVLLGLTWTEWREVKQGCPQTEGPEGCFGPKGSSTTLRRGR